MTGVGIGLGVTEYPCSLALVADVIRIPDDVFDKYSQIRNSCYCIISCAKSL